jgi:hypothetical protein
VSELTSRWSPSLCCGIAQGLQRLRAPYCLVIPLAPLTILGIYHSGGPSWAIPSNHAPLFTTVLGCEALCTSWLFLCVLVFDLWGIMLPLESEVSSPSTLTRCRSFFLLFLFHRRTEADYLRLYKNGYANSTQWTLALRYGIIVLGCGLLDYRLLSVHWTGTHIVQLPGCGS